MLAQVGEEEAARLIFQDIESDWSSLGNLVSVPEERSL